MKEYVAKVGGRYTYVEDLIALQELALSITNIFEGCKNFVLSGCNTSGSTPQNTTISAGFVYINGKIRPFPGASVNLSTPYYIVEQNTTENIKYAQEVTRHGRDIFGAIGLTDKPTDGRQYIEISDTMIPRLQDAFFGKYSLLLKETKKQKIAGDVDFGESVSVEKDLSTSGALSVKDISRELSLIHSFDQSGNGMIDYKKGKNTTRILFGASNKVSILINNNEVFSIDNDSASFSSILSSSFNNKYLKIDQDDIINHKEDNDAAGININYTGFQNGTSRFRNFNVYDGKKSLLFTVNGSSGVSHFYGSMQASTVNELGLSLQNPSHGYSDVLYKKKIAWFDKDGVEMAKVGFLSDQNSLFSIATPYSDFEITPKNYLNVAKPIKEMGILLSEKYAPKESTKKEINRKVEKENGMGLSQENFTTDFKNKLDKIAGGEITTGSEGYITGKQVADQVALLTTKSGNLSDLKDKSEARKNLEVQSITDADKKYIQTNNKLSEFSTLAEVDKITVRNNIGAAKGGESYLKNEVYQKNEVYTQKESDRRFAPIYNDSGWVHIKDELYARQVGCAVYIQGTVQIPKNGQTWFTIPTTIGSPGKKIGGIIQTVIHSSEDERGFMWECNADSRDVRCVVEYEAMKDREYISTFINYAV